MRQHHDPLVPLRRARKTGETPAETEQRLNADLRALMNDARYRDNDQDFRHYVQRQFRRVYDDPSGERPKYLTIGRPRTYASALEPFDRRREQMLRRETEAGESEGAKVTSGRNLPQNARINAIGNFERRDAGTYKVQHARLPRDRQVDTDEGQFLGDEAEKLPQEDRVYPRGGNAGRSPQTQKKKRIEHIISGVEGMIAAAEREGLVMAPMYLRRYLDGVGGVVQLDWSTVRAHRPAAVAEQTVRNLHELWLTGQKKDRTIGAPFLALQDGEVLEIGRLWKPSDVFWSKAFDPDFGDASLDSSLVFGVGEIESYGKLRFERHGDEITVSGTVAFVLNERYDFEGFGFKTYYISTFKSDGPTITNYDLKYLADHGPAAEYGIQSRHIAEISGNIILVDGVPDPELSSFTWRDLDRHHS